jgi:antitoxin (DNA-binding transcriptional repressor) of toxin-antitoxin stability system
MEERRVMKSMTVGEFKSRFSAVLETVRRGGSVTVCYGRQRRPMAVLVPARPPRRGAGRRLGILAATARAEFVGEWAVSDGDLLRG